MARGTATQRANRITTFEDLGGLRAEGYVRDSTLDQRDGFGPGVEWEEISSRHAGRPGAVGRRAHCAQDTAQPAQERQGVSAGLSLPGGAVAGYVVMAEACKRE